MKNIQWKIYLEKISQKLSDPIQKLYQKLNLENWESLLLILLGLFAFLAGEQQKLRVQFLETQRIAESLAKKTGLKVYAPEDLTIRQIGDVFVQIPKEWTNIIPDYLITMGIRKHFIASSGTGFALPYANEYAFIVGIERRGVTTDLETFLKDMSVSSDPEKKDVSYIKVNDSMFYILREGVGREYFRKVDDAILVIFVYDNGDREVDDFEQRFINSVGPVEKNTLFDYK